MEDLTKQYEGMSGPCFATIACSGGGQFMEVKNMDLYYVPQSERGTPQLRREGGVDVAERRCVPWMCTKCESLVCWGDMWDTDHGSHLERGINTIAPYKGYGQKGLNHKGKAQQSKGDTEGWQRVWNQGKAHGWGSTDGQRQT